MSLSYNIGKSVLYSIEKNENYEALNKDGENLAQIQFAIRNEMAVTLSDIMLLL